MTRASRRRRKREKGAAHGPPQPRLPGEESVPDTPARALARGLLERQPRKRRDNPPPVLEETRRFRAVVAYDGTGYAGWQRQHAQVSVQEILEVALEAATRLPVTTSSAGRTDVGVHADGQVVSFDSRTALPADALFHLCEHVLPPDVRVLRVEEAPPGFNPQRHVVRKLYRYDVLDAPEPLPRRRSSAWWVGDALDLAAMRAAAAHLVGTHDFKAFRNDPGPARRVESTVRTVDSLEVERVGELVRVEAVGPGFLYMMVRNVVAALVAVGRGEHPPEWVGRMLAARDRRRLPPPAPAHGLTLVRVEYPDGFGGPAGRAPPGRRRRPRPAPEGSRPAVSIPPEAHF